MTRAGSNVPAITVATRHNACVGDLKDALKKPLRSVKLRRDSCLSSDGAGTHTVLHLAGNRSPQGRDITWLHYDSGFAISDVLVSAELVRDDDSFSDSHSIFVHLLPARVPCSMLYGHDN